MAASPQRLEAAVDYAAVAARVEEAAEKVVRDQTVSPQRLKPELKTKQLPQR